MALMNAGKLKGDKFYELFSDWFIRTTNSDEHAMWYPTILEECVGDEEKALDRFWQYLEAFDKVTELRPT
jgi:hypothetical protein